MFEAELHMTVEAIASDRGFDFTDGAFSINKRLLLTLQGPYDQNPGRPGLFVVLLEVSVWTLDWSSVRVVCFVCLLCVCAR